MGSCYFLTLFYVSFFSINCIVVSSLLISPSIDKPCNLKYALGSPPPPPRLGHELFARRKVM